MFIILNPDGTLIRQDLPAVAVAVRAAVGGYFDIVRMRGATDDLCAFVNDEGHNLGLDRNPVGACVVVSLGASPHVYAGPVVVTGWNAHANGSEITDLSEDQVTLVETMHRVVTAALEVRLRAGSLAWLHDYAEHVRTAPTPHLSFSALTDWGSGVTTRKPRAATTVPALDATICERSDQPRYACWHCRGLPDVPVLEDEEREVLRPGMGPQVDAYWPGKCTGCGTRYEPGEPIRTDGYGGWVRVECCGGGHG